MFKLLAVIAGGLYIYKTKDTLLGWYAKYVIREESEPSGLSPQQRYHKQRVSAFNLLEEMVNGKRLLVFAGDSFIQTFERGEYFSELQSNVVIVNRGIAGDTI